MTKTKTRSPRGQYITLLRVIVRHKYAALTPEEREITPLQRLVEEAELCPEVAALRAEYLEEQTKLLIQEGHDFVRWSVRQAFPLPPKVMPAELEAWVDRVTEPESAAPRNFFLRLKDRICRSR